MSRSNKAITALVVLLAVTSFSLGVPGLLQAAELGAVPRALRPLVPLMIDAGLVVFAVAAVRLRAKGKPGLFAWAWMGGLTLSSMALQIAHVIAVQGTTGVTPVIGSALAASFPLITFAASHTAISLTVGAPVTKARAHRVAAVAITVKSSTAVASGTRAHPSSPTGFVPAATTPPKKARQSSSVLDPRVLRALEMREQTPPVPFERIAAELEWSKTGVQSALAKHRAALASLSAAAQPTEETMAA
jgi:hypothetical protein